MKLPRSAAAAQTNNDRISVLGVSVCVGMVFLRRASRALCCGVNRLLEQRPAPQTDIAGRWIFWKGAQKEKR
jgi:hypothetical protein